MKIIAVIPARGGSESIPLKNLKKFNGKPLIAWTILSAKKSKHVDRVIVSTDHPKIAQVAKKYGAEVPFFRPKEISGPTMGVEPTLKHAYEWLIKKEGYKADGIVLLMIPNTLRQPYHIDEAIDIFKNKKVDSVVAVSETPANHTPFWTLVRSKQGKVSLYGGVELKDIPVRRQDFPYKCYGRNDLVYVLKPKNLFEKKPNLYGKKVELYETSHLFESDINGLDDWHDAEIRFKALMRKIKQGELR